MRWRAVIAWVGGAALVAALAGTLVARRTAPSEPPASVSAPSATLEPAPARVAPPADDAAGAPTAGASSFRPVSPRNPIASPSAESVAAATDDRVAGATDRAVVPGRTSAGNATSAAKAVAPAGEARRPTLAARPGTAAGPAADGGFVAGNPAVAGSGASGTGGIDSRDGGGTAEEDRAASDEAAPVPRVPVRLRLEARQQRDLLRVTVFVEGARDLASLPFHVRFDAARLRFESAVEGPFLRSDGRAAVFTAAALSSGDTVVVGASRLGPGPGVGGSGVLGTLTFRVLAAGPAPLVPAEAWVIAADGHRVPVVTAPASVVLQSGE